MTVGPILNRYGTYPPGFFKLRTRLAPVIELIDRVLIEWCVDAPFRDHLRWIRAEIIDLVADDELGLIGATPEQRIAFLERLT